MIKRIIFDIDNTLIQWLNEYYEQISKELNNLQINYTEEDIEKIKEALREYEDKYYTFNKENMANFINEYTQKEYPIEFLNNILKRFGNCVEEKANPQTVKMLEYLKNKYELVILTDWYKEGQVNRLKKIYILKYFSEVYCAENTKRKPFKEAFLQAIGKNKPEECIMIGDNFERDIQGALNVGLKAIHYASVKNETKEYITITRLEELINIL